MKKLLYFLLLFFTITLAQAQPGPGPLVCVGEEDGSPSVDSTCGYGIKMANGTVTDNGDGTISVTGGGSGAPTDATYITQTTNGTLSAEQDLASLSSGIMRVATTTGVVTALTDSAGIATNVSDETGTGVMVFGTAPTITTSASFGSAGVRLSDDGDGALTFLGLGNGFDEDLTLNLDDTSNTGVLSSSTGLNLLDFGSIGADYDSSTVTLSTVSGVIDAGGATSLEVPNGTNPTVSVAGQVSVDTSATSGSMIRFYGDASYQLPGYYSMAIQINGATASSDAPVWRCPWNVTIRAVHVLATGGTNVVGMLDECDANGANCSTVDSADITGTAGTNANDDGALSNSSIDATDYIGWHTTSVSGTNTRVAITFEYTIDAVN